MWPIFNILSWTWKWISQPFRYVFSFQQRQIDKTSSWLHPSRSWGRSGPLVLVFHYYYYYSAMGSLSTEINFPRRMRQPSISAPHCRLLARCRARALKVQDTRTRFKKVVLASGCCLVSQKKQLKAVFSCGVGVFNFLWRTNLCSHGRHHRDMLNSVHAACWPSLIWIVIKQVMHHSMSSSEQISSSNKHSSQLQSSSSKMSTQELTSNLSELKSSMSEMKSSLSSHLVAAANAAAQSSAAKFPSAGLLQGMISQ